MGGASSGGSDDQVSGAEAVATGGTTYSSRKTSTVNKQIAEQNKKNRESRRSPIAKIFDATLIGRTAKAISNSKFVQDNNYNRRVAFAKKSGKFTNTDLTNREFVLSSGFKTQLEGQGYLKEPGNVGGNDRDNNQPILTKTTYVEGVNAAVTTPTKAEVDQATATTMSANENLLATNKKGRSQNILTSATGLGNNKLNIKKKTLG
tara:strand:+ start:702 stop:1316 length:615 start_codon:yes stop_codon:yes gene_type:complete